MSDIRIALVGSVSFSRRTLESLIRHGAHVVGVLGLDASASRDVSDFDPLSEVATAAAIPFRAFTKINTPEIVQQIRDWNPDLLFVVGLSQLVHDEILSIPRMGSIGFHPTRLPVGRGRAPIAWLTWDGTPGAATFFVIEAEADAGAIFVQEPFDVAPGMYAHEVIDAARHAIDSALDRWLPQLLAGVWNPLPQDPGKATFWGKRAAEDGHVDWTNNAAEIERLVRTAARPYPGAYTYWRDQKLLIWRASATSLPFRGVTGRILQTWPDGAALVQCGSGLLRVEEYALESNDRPRLNVGQKLGFSMEHEIGRLKERIRLLEERFEK